MFTHRNLVVSNDFLSVGKLCYVRATTTTTKVLDYLTHSPRVARVLSLFLTNCANHYREKMSQHDIRPESLHNLSVRFAVNATQHCPPPDIVLVQFRTTFAILMLIYVRKIPDPYNLSAPCEPFVGIQSFVMNGSFWHLLLMPASPSRTFLIIQLALATRRRRRRRRRQ